MRTLVAGRGQDVRVGCRGAHVRLVPKREGYISLFCLDAHPTPSPASCAHLEDARLDAHLRILVGFPPPLGLDAGVPDSRRSCGRRSPRSPVTTCDNSPTCWVVSLAHARRGSTLQVTHVWSSPARSPRPQGRDTGKPRAKPCLSAPGAAEVSATLTPRPRPQPRPTLPAAVRHGRIIMSERRERFLRLHVIRRER